ncbi:MAG: TCP-1/cpn60 chaperonin family protein [Candidatus Poseidoniaceae archaeon]
MAQQGDGSGRAPVVIVRPTTSVTSGVAVTQKLVGAAAAFGDILRRTFGPNGLDKMMYKTNGENAITNDGAKIVADLLVKHPAAKAFVQLAESQENACGDGVTGCLLFASELMKEAGRLLERGVHPLVLVEAYQDSIMQTLDILDERSMKDVGVESLHSIAKTAMVGKSAEAGGDALAQLLVECMTTIQSSGQPVRAENVRMTKRGHDSLQETRLIKGVVIDKKFDSERTPKITQPSGVLALTCPLTIQKTKRDAEIEIERPEQMVAFLDAEERLLDEKIEVLMRSGANVVFTSKEVDDRIQHACNNNGILLVGMMEDDGIEDIAAATGATLINHLDDVAFESLGILQSALVDVSEHEDGRRTRLIVNVGPSSGLVTIDVGGGQGAAVEEYIRAMYDALRTLESVLEHPRTLLGGGSFHIAAALRLREEGESISGRQRLAIEGFARALETIPSTLALNAGEDQIDALLQLRAAHRNQSNQFGVCKDGKIGEIKGVLLSSHTVAHALQAAVETACGLLRVDQVISSRGD